MEVENTCRKNGNRTTILNIFDLMGKTRSKNIVMIANTHGTTTMTKKTPVYWSVSTYPRIMRYTTVGL